MKKPVNKTRIKKTRKTHVFLIFLGLSTVLWSISKLSKEYTHTVKVKTNYINFTSDKELQNKPKDYVELVLKSSGFNMLNYAIFNKKIDIDLSKTQKNNSKYYYVTNNNLPSLQAQLAIDKTILKVYPDTLFFDFGNLSSKQIKIIPQFKLNYKTSYGLVGELEMLPKKVTINGTEDQIKNIVSVNTTTFSVNNIAGDFEYKIPLDIPKEYHKIRFSAKEISVKGVVEKFTEAKLELPFELVNMPKDYTVKTFVDKISITYKVSLENYDKIKASDFKIICDYNKVKNANSSFLIPEIHSKSNLVTHVKMKPNKIEFLIKK